MKKIILIIATIGGASGFAQQQLYYNSLDNNLNSFENIAPVTLDELALYPGENTDFKNMPLKNTTASYRYKGKNYYLQPIENGYILQTSSKDKSQSVMRLKEVGTRDGFLFIDDLKNTAYAYFDSKSNLIIEFYDLNTRKVKQLKIEPELPNANKKALKKI